MKRIQAACLLQTIHFQLKEDLDHDTAVRAVEEEYDHYKKLLDRKGVQYKITREEKQPDGSILVRIQKQYNGHSCGDYMN